MYPYLDFRTKHEQRVTTSFIPQFIDRTSLNRDVVVINCFPAGRKTDEEDYEEWVEFIEKNVSDFTIVVFENAYEGNVISCLDKIYSRIESIGLNPNSVIFASGGLNVKEMHKQYCIENNIQHPIDVVALNMWEHAVARNPRGFPETKYTIGEKEKTYLSFNRISRPQRVALVSHLFEKGFIENGYCSFLMGSYNNTPFLHSVQSMKDYLSTSLYKRYYSAVMRNLHTLPLLLNVADRNSNINYHIDGDDKYYRNSRFSIVTETFFFKLISPKYDEVSIFLSEKTFKPMVGKHPFINMNRPHTLKYLRSMGYRTFSPWFDEAYDDIENDEQRLLAIFNEIDRLCSLTQSEWNAIEKDIAPIIEHNYTTLKNKQDFEFRGIR